MERADALCQVPRAHGGIRLVRVAMVVPHFPLPVMGGLERQAFELAVAVRAQGVDAWVISGRFAPDQPRHQVVSGVPVVRVPFPQSKWIRFPVTGLALVACLVTRRRDFDVLHLHNLSWFGVLCLIVAKLLRKPVLGKLPTGTSRAFQSGPLRLRMFQSCDAIALLTAESIDDFLRLGYPRSRIFANTNGVSTTRFSPGPPHAADGSAPLRVVFTGRLDPGKGLLDLLAVWPAVLRRVGRPLRLSLCGEGSQRDELQQTIEREGLQESVELRGRVADIVGELKAADLFVLPSYIEGNSNAVLEAMASGLPIVSTLAGGTPLLVGGEGYDWLVTPRDRSALEERIVRLLCEPETRRRVGQAMLERARALFAIDVIASRYASVYELLAAGRRDEVASCSSPLFTDAAIPAPSVSR